MYRLPQMASGQLQRVKQWIQSNRSDTIGNLAWTFNMDPYYNLGKIRPTRMMCTDSLSNPVDAVLTDVPVGFRFYRDLSSKIFTVAGSFVHVNTGVPNGNFIKFTTYANYPTNCNSAYSDLEVFNGYLYVTTASNVVYKLLDQSGWSNFTVTTDTSSGHNRAMCTFGNRLYMSTIWQSSGGTGITSWDTSDTFAASSTSQYAIRFDPQGISKVTFLRSAANRIWVGVNAGYLTKGKGYVYEWDGSSNQFTRGYRLEATSPMACVIKDDIPYVMDSNGRLLKYNSGSFQEIARLPLFDKYLYNPMSGANNTTFIHPNGMTIVNGKINMLINNQVYDNAGSIVEQCPSGVWEYDENVGLYHKYSLSYTVTNRNTITDYGQNRLSAVGALADMKIDSTTANSNGTFLAGATIFTSASATASQVWTNDTLPYSTTATYHSTLRGGYFVTTKLESTGITDIWKAISYKYKKLINSADSIVIKYRTSEVAPVESTITWVNSTYFTTSGISGFVVGDEVEITQGPGGGMCSHITAITYDGSSTYGVTVDTAHTGVTTGTAKARFQKWVKISSITNDQTSQYKWAALPALATSPWIQFKVFILMDESDEFEEIAVVNSPSQSLK